MRFAQRNHSFFHWRFQHCSQRMQSMRIAAEGRSATPVSQELTAAQTGTAAKPSLGSQSRAAKPKGHF